jgi:hypothetical protein
VTDEGRDRADRTGDAVAHLQAAAREMIAAARAFLDVAEEVVEDPEAGEALLASLGDVARRVVPRDGAASDGDGVQHIPVD